MAGEGYIATNRALMVSLVSGNVSVDYGTHTTVDEDDTVATKLRKVIWAAAQLESDPVLGCDRALAFIGDQAGSPASGSIQIKTFKPTGAGDTTPVAATTFSKKVNWIAVGEV